MRYCPQCSQPSDNDRQRFCLADGVRLSLPDPYRLVGGTLAGRYRIEALEGIGGFGAVYRAQHLALERQMAFKILKPDLALQMPGAVSLFESEARLVGRLRHENIVEVFDSGRTPDGLVYLAMEWLDGAPLDEELQAHGPFSLARTAEVLRQISAALAAAHAQRIIHRDLKPSNVMLLPQPEGGERVKVLDFGIAKVLSSDAGALTVSQVSRPIGTPHYASPEQLQTNAQIDRRSDVYALGVLLYEMLTGALPFRANTIGELIQQKLTDAPRPLRELRPELPAAVDALVRRMLRCDKEQRPRHVGEIPALFAAACRTAETTTPAISAETSPVPQQQQTGAYAAPFLHDLEEGLESRETRAADEALPTRLLPEAPRLTKAVQQTTSAAPEAPPTEADREQEEKTGRPLNARVLNRLATRQAKRGAARSLFNARLLSRLAASALVVFLTLGVGSYFFLRTQQQAPAKIAMPTGAALPQAQKLLAELESQMVTLPSGSFVMGSYKGDADEKPLHRVALASFRIGKYEVTQAQWEAVMASNPSHFSGAQLPVESVTWEEAQEFCRRLSQMTGRTYRLPTEAEWEYAARGGNPGEYGFGDDQQQLGQYAWYKANSAERTHPVGQKLPNAFGLYDLHGNVWEWCEDQWHSNYKDAPEDGSAWVDNVARRVMRGGGWNYSAQECRAADRAFYAPSVRDSNVGFRLASSAR